MNPITFGSRTVLTVPSKPLADHKVSDIERTGYDTEECYLEDPDGYELWVSAPVPGE